MRRTKIVCTIGPASREEGILRELIRAGMDVARINFSHGDRTTHASDISLIRRLAAEEGRLVAILGDLQGPRLRVGEIPGGKMLLSEGETVSLTAHPAPPSQIPLPYADWLSDLSPGDRILLDDGLLELEVEEASPAGACCKVLAGGVLLSRKGISLPGVSLSLPSLTEKDKEDVDFALEQGVDYLALSFVRRASDIFSLKGLLEEKGAEIPIIAKIEKREALENFDEILAASDGVMVARGDLGVEIPAEEVPTHQKEIIRKANEAGKPVITATQMLDSMMQHPRPTRAEASDVANAIWDGTDALMLSGETAVGKYPIEAVKMMARIAITAEKAFPYEDWARRAAFEIACTPTDAISQATCEIALELGARVIVTSTTTGYTARMVAKHRPATPIIAITPSPATQRCLALVWGVESFLVESFSNTDQMIETAVNTAREKGLVEKGDTVVITAGVPLGGPGRTNMLKIEIIE